MASSATIDFLSGTAGGIACVYVGQPLDTLKVKMQSFPHLYTNPYSCLVQTYVKDGIARGLYAGTVPALAANIAENSVLFMSYGLCQRAICTLSSKKNINELNSLENALSGATAGFLASFVLCPTELVKCKLQSARERSNAGNVGPVNMIKEIYASKGFVGFFDGLVSTIVREMPGYFIFFGAYEFSREVLTPKGKKKDDLGPGLTALCGGIAGVTFWTSVFPADVIKSRVQVDPNSPLAKKSFISAVATVAREEGVAKLYSGLVPGLLRTFIATGALFVTVEWTRKLLNYAVGIESD